MSRIAIYSHDSNPAIDIPMLYKKPSYVLDMVDKGRMVWLTPDSAQSVRPNDQPDKRNQRCQHEDWVTRDVSFLPKGQHLNITTKQLDA